jgi:DNA-binding NarL/FixJ family response regulator
LLPTRVLLADAYPVCLQGLRRVLSADPDVSIVAEVRSGDELVVQTLALRPDVIVLDVDLEGASGIVALGRVRAIDDSVRAVFVTARTGDWIDLAYDAGASAALDKRQDLDELPAIVRRVAAGQTLPPPRPASRRATWPPITLTPREIEVLSLIVAGSSSKEIAGKIGTAVSTVEKHRESIRKKAHLHNTAEIVRFGFLYFMEKRLRDRDGDTRPGSPALSPP